MVTVMRTSKFDRLDEKLVAAFKKTFGRAPTQEEFRIWHRTIEGQAAVNKIADDEWKAVGKSNPNQPYRWPKSTWRGWGIK